MIAFPFAKSKSCKCAYALIQSRDFERAHAWLRERAAAVGQDADYYKCLAKIAALQGDHASAIERYEQSIAASGSGTQRFLVYGDLIRLLYLAERGADAQQLLDRALEDLECVLQRRILPAQALVHLSKFVQCLGLAGLYVEVLSAKWCWNPWQAKLRAARHAVAPHRATFAKLSALQAQHGYHLDALKSGSEPPADAVDVVVFWPMGYLSLVLRDFDGVFAYFETILNYLQQQQVRFTLKNQYVLNRCPQLEGVKVLSWHTCGRVHGVRHLKESPFAGFFYFDRAGYSGWAALATWPDAQVERALAAIPDLEAEAYFQSLVSRFIAARKSKYAQPHLLCAPLPSRYVFIPMQLLDDYVAQLTDWNIFDLIRTMTDLLEGTDVSLVVKRHPKCTHWRVDDFLAKLEGHSRVCVVDAPIHDLMEGSIAVCTVNSGVGAEALLLCKPVFTVSPTDYGFLTHDLRTVRSGAEFVALCERKVDRRRYAQFMTFYCRDYLVDAADPSAITQRIDQWLGAAS